MLRTVVASVGVLDVMMASGMLGSRDLLPRPAHLDLMRILSTNAL